MDKKKIINRRQIIPAEYSPTEQIIFCGNQIFKYKYLIEDNGFYPILIGSGEIPRIWIFTRMPNKNIMTVVDDSVSNLNRIKIDIRNSEKIIEITDTQHNITILRLSYLAISSILHIDLRPIGYYIHGDEEKLMIGHSSFYRNTISNVGVVIGLSHNKEHKRVDL